MKKILVVTLAFALAVAVAGIGCTGRTASTGQSDLLQLANARGLSPEDAARAVKTFVPPGGRDEYMLFASGGHSGQVHVIGVPSMRLLKTIAVFTPEPWQGYGYGADWSEAALDGESNPDARPSTLRWGDSHHPALSETDGKYDGRWLYINDRAHGRIGMVDLGDFRAKQVLQVPEPADLARRRLRDARHALRAHLVEGPGAEGLGREQGTEDHARRSPESLRRASTAATRPSCASTRRPAA